MYCASFIVTHLQRGNCNSFPESLTCKELKSGTKKPKKPMQGEIRPCEFGEWLVVLVATVPVAKETSLFENQVAACHVSSEIHCKENSSIFSSLQHSSLQTGQRL